LVGVVAFFFLGFADVSSLVAVLINE
jgi:hypothetical protein